MTYVFQCPFFKDGGGAVHDSFMYVGILLDIAIESTLKELTVMDKDDEIVSCEINGLMVGDSVVIETLFIDEIKLRIIDKHYG